MKIEHAVFFLFTLPVMLVKEVLQTQSSFHGSVRNRKLLPMFQVNRLMGGATTQKQERKRVASIRVSCLVPNLG